MFLVKNFIKKNKIYFILLFFLVFASYFNSFNNDFVSDDRGIIIHADSWTIDYLISHPLSLLRSFLYFVTYKTFGLNPFFFRIANLFFHLGSVFLVYILVGLMTKPKIGILTASLFAVHPILIESVVWISGGVYAQYSFFFLIAFLSYFIFKKTLNKKWLLGSLIFFVFSMLSSEKAIALSPIFLIFEICFGKIKENWKITAIFLILSAVFILFSVSKIEDSFTMAGEQSQSSSLEMENSFVQIPIAITSYFQLILWPKDLTLYHSEMIFSQQEYLFRLCIFIIFLIGIIYSFLKNKKIFFWICFFIISLLPALTPFKISWIVAERYVYLGSIGLFVLIAYFFGKLSEIKKIKLPIYTVFILIIIALSIRTIVRNIDWQNEDNLWIATGKTSPSSPNNHNNLGDVYGRHGNLEGATLEFQTAIKLKPNYADAYHNLANIQMQMEKFDEAIINYQKAIHFNPNLWQSYKGLAIVYFQKKQFDLAILQLQKAIKINPQSSDLLTDLAVIYLQTENKLAAKEAFSKALLLNPNNVRAKTGLNQSAK
ncbi:MAG: tetratricopeptide repeat protein [Candidatus Levyibacteriota bacterium]